MTLRYLVTGKLLTVLLPALVTSVIAPCLRGDNDGKDPTAANALAKVAKGRQVFRFDTFGDETFWGGTLKLHQAIEGAALGGVGPGVSPKTNRESFQREAPSSRPALPDHFEDVERRNRQRQQTEDVPKDSERRPDPLVERPEPEQERQERRE